MIARQWLAGRAVGLLLVTLVVCGLLMAMKTPKVSVYMDLLEESGGLYAVPFLAPAALFFLIRYPPLTVLAVAFLLPFNVAGGEYTSVWASAGKIVLNAAFFASLLATWLVPAEQRAWILRTWIGAALLFWLFVIAMATLIGFFNTPNQGDWLRESNWMWFYAFALPAGTLLRSRDDIRRALWASGAGVAVMQLLAFRLLVTGQRYDRLDIVGGEGFFRAPFSTLAAFMLLLALAALLQRLAETTPMRWPRRIALFGSVAVLTAGLLASMGRALWISFAVGAATVVVLTPWNRRTLRAGLVVAAGLGLAVGVVVVIDSASAQSRGNWIASATSFLFQLGGDGGRSISVLSRELEWTHAFDVWKLSPFVGQGFGYPFPDIPYNVAPADPFYMHNSYMNVLAKCGAFGLAALVAVIALSLWRLADTRSSPVARIDDRVLTTGLAAGIVQVAALSVFVPALTTTDSIMGFAFLVGLTVAHHRRLARERAA